MPTPAANQIHAALLALAVLLTAYATGFFALAFVPLLVLLYVGVFYRMCPYRTEIVCACLFGAHLGIAYTGVWLIVAWELFGRESQKWFAMLVAGAFMLLAFAPIAAGAIAGVRWWLRRSRGQSVPPKAGVATGVIIVALLLAPAWFLAAALAWHSCQSMSEMAEPSDGEESRSRSAESRIQGCDLLIAVVRPQRWLPRPGRPEFSSSVPSR